jgi:hypothetical protein
MAYTGDRRGGSHVLPIGGTAASACGICDVTQRTVIKSQCVNDIRVKPHRKQSITRHRALIVLPAATL